MIDAMLYKHPKINLKSFKNSLMNKYRKQQLKRKP